MSLLDTSVALAKLPKAVHRPTAAGGDSLLRQCGHDHVA